MFATTQAADSLLLVRYNLYPNQPTCPSSCTSHPPAPFNFFSRLPTALFSIILSFPFPLWLHTIFLVSGSLALLHVATQANSDNFLLINYVPNTLISWAKSMRNEEKGKRNESELVREDGMNCKTWATLPIIKESLFPTDKWYKLLQFQWVGRERERDETMRNK